MTHAQGQPKPFKLSNMKYLLFIFKLLVEFYKPRCPNRVTSYGIFDFIGQGLTNLMTQIENKKSRRWEEQQSNKQWTRDRQMWMEQNEYNSPKAQMERYEEAGLNPHLMYQQGNPGNATTMPTWQRPRGKFGGFNFDKIGSMLTAKTNYDILKTQAKNLEEQGQGIVLDNKKKEILNRILENVADEKEAYELQKYISGVDMFKAEAGKKVSDAQWAEWRNTMYEETGINIDKDSIMWRAVLGRYGGKDGNLTKLIDNINRLMGIGTKTNQVIGNILGID